jgi:uncharacterized cupin superfamily protein
VSDDGRVQRFNVHSAPYEPLPEFGGKQAILYSSPDRTRLAGTFQESGTHTLVMPFDEFMYVVGGSCRISVQDGDSFELSAGDCCYLRQGMNVTFEMAEDFHDVTVLISDTPIAVDGLEN